MDNRTIKQRIRKLREENGFTQQRMADLLGIDRNTYRGIEQGNTDIIYKRLPDIAGILAVSMEELMLGPVSDSCPPELEDAKTQYNEKLGAMSREYDDKLLSLRKELDSKDELIDTLKGQIRDKDEIIALLRKRSRG